MLSVSQCQFNSIQFNSLPFLQAKTPSKATPKRLHQLANASKSIRKTPNNSLHKKALLSSAKKAVHQTPLALHPHLPKTPSSRNPRFVSRSDSILSVNGSPLVNPYGGAVEADGSASRASSTHAVPITARKEARASSILALPLNDDSASDFILELDPSKPSSTDALLQLDSPAKRQVVQHLERLQQHLQSLVAQVKK